MFAPVLYKTSGTARDYLKEYFLTKMDISNYIIKIGVPPALTGLATLLLASWVLAYIIQLSQYSFLRRLLVHLKWFWLVLAFLILPVDFCIWLLGFRSLFLVYLSFFHLPYSRNILFFAVNKSKSTCYDVTNESPFKNSF